MAGGPYRAQDPFPGSSISGLENTGAVTFSLVTTGPEASIPPLSDSA